MPRKLTLSGPETLRNPLNDTLHIEWYLLGKGSKGYCISWLEAAADTGLPECMAFEVKTGVDGIARVTNWRERAVSYNRDAALALEQVVKQLEELYDVVVSVGDPASALRPGEVVSRMPSEAMPSCTFD